MKINGWIYYNHAAIPSSAPHIEPDTTPIQNGDIWHIDGGTTLLARWTTDFDCEHETNWWHVIKDTPFDISQLKAKRRYEINKGIKNFDVLRIDPRDYKEALYQVQVTAYSAYPEKYRPTVNKERFFSGIDRWDRHTVFGAFHRETKELCGYALLATEHSDCIEFRMLKAKPAQERNGINAALVAGLLEYFETFLAEGGYICDGERSINHETAFQDYLEKYFGFRKAYCKLQIRYKWWFSLLIRGLYPFRKLLRRLDSVRKIHLVNSLLKMEEVSTNRKG